MYIKSIDLNNFRNYKNLSIELNDKFNIFFGDNAQGKTNILESIFLSATGKSHRTNHDYDLILFGDISYKVRVTLCRENYNKSITINYDGIKKIKEIFINDIKINRISDLIGNINVVLFSPESLNIINGGPNERRKFIDLMICQISKKYLNSLQNYNRILKQKNAILKENNPNKVNMLKVYNEALIDVGSEIVFKRLNILNEMKDIFISYHNILTDNKEVAEIKYVCSFLTDTNINDYLKIKESYNAKIKKYFEKEMEYRKTLFGPHRDDLSIIINNKDVKTYGSQGQKRSIVLSIKMTEMEIMKNTIGYYPILLMDDVLSELDELRKNKILKLISDTQIFITTANRDFVDNKNNLNKNFKFFEIRNGNVV